MEINKLTTLEASESIPYDESAALIENDNKHDSTKESLGKEVERRESSSDCKEFFSTRKDSLTLLSATFESILLVEKTPIIKSLQEKDRTIEDYVKIEQDLRDKVKKLESFTTLSRQILTQIASELKEENAELSHKLIAADEEIKANNEEMEKLTIDKTALEEDNVDLKYQLEAVHDENTALVQVKSSMQEKYKLQLQTVNKEKKVLEVDNSALKSNIVKLKSRLRTDIVDVIIVTFLGFLFGLLQDPVSLTHWLRGQV